MGDRNPTALGYHGNGETSLHDLDRWFLRKLLTSMTEDYRAIYKRQLQSVDLLGVNVLSIDMTNNMAENWIPARMHVTAMAAPALV